MNFRLYFFIIIMLLTALTLPCAGAPAASGGIKGQVVDGENAPVEGVKVFLNGKQAVTDQTGNFTLENLPAGDYLIHTYSNRFLNKIAPVKIKTGENTTQTVQIKIRLTKLEGLIVDEESHPVIGVEIYTFPEIDETKTDERGYFILDKKRVLDANKKPIGEEPITAGEYTVYAQKLQYTKAEKKVTIVPGLLNNLGTLVINKIGVTIPEGEKRDLEAPPTIDEPTQGMGDVKLD